MGRSIGYNNIYTMANGGLLGFRHKEMQNIAKCLKLDRPRLRPLSVVSEHGFLRCGLLSFRPQVTSQSDCFIPTNHVLTIYRPVFSQAGWLICLRHTMT